MRFVHADHVVDIGPGAGVHGGKIVAARHAKTDHEKSEFINRTIFIGQTKIAIPKKSNTCMIQNECIAFKRARCNNLKNIDVRYSCWV